ncbi:hypothetical protein K8S19_13680 [bacterium]|nr:hypothetical protein [bacterium]
MSWTYKNFEGRCDLPPVPQGKEIVTTEAINCKANDMQATKDIQGKYYKAFGSTLAEEKLTIS